MDEDELFNVGLGGSGPCTKSSTCEEDQNSIMCILIMFRLIYICKATRVVFVC